MPIQHISLLEPVKASAPVTPDEAERIAQGVVSSIGTSYRDFQLASSYYNSVFFRSENAEVTRATCRALKAHFPNYSNSYWNKAAGV